MTKYGSDYDRQRARFKAECAARNAPCWLCRNRIGPIDYQSKYDPTNKNPLLFSVDHMDPASLGHDVMRVDRWKPAHLGCNVSRGNTTRGQFPTSRNW